MGLFGNLFGGAQLKKASKKARDATLASLNQATDEQKQIMGQIGGYYSPYQTFGGQALGQYGDLLGTNGAAAQQSAIDALKASPYFQSLYKTGEEGVLQNASATGGLRGGNTEHSLYDLGTNTLAQTIQQQLQNLSPGVQMGYGTAGALSNAAMGTGNNIADYILGQGQAKAQDILTRGSINNNVWSGIGSTLLNLGSMAAGLPPGMFSGMTGGGSGGGGFNLSSLFGGGGNPLAGMGVNLNTIFGGSGIGTPDLSAGTAVNLGASPLTSMSGGNISVPDYQF